VGTPAKELGIHWQPSRRRAREAQEDVVRRGCRGVLPERRDGHGERDCQAVAVHRYRGQLLALFPAGVANIAAGGVLGGDGDETTEEEEDGAYQ
jgi:hypothetical protein